MLETQMILNEAISLHQQGNLQKACGLYESILTTDPDHSDALHLLGLIALQTQNYQSASDLIGKAILHSPDNALFYCNRGVALKNLGNHPLALESYNSAIRLHPEYAEAYNNRGITQKELHLDRDALVSFEHAIHFQPGFAEAFSNRGIVLHRLGQLDAAVSSFNTAIALQPHYGSAYCYRGAVFKDQHNFDAALQDFEQAILLNPHDAEAQSHTCTTLLICGEFQKGWSLYDWRWKNKNFTADKIRSNKPEWRPGQKQRVLLWAEQGIGDEIMFSSLLGDFQHHCTALIVEVDERLISLYQRSMPEGITFAPRQSTVHEDTYDSQISMASLCRFLRHDEASFLQARQPFLRSDATRAARIRNELGIQPGRVVCGISWNSKNTEIGIYKSTQVKEFIRHLDLPDCQWVNLQYGDVSEEIAHVKAELNVEILQCHSVDNLQDIDGLAALIEVCDVVISISNTTVHLAGALGKQVHVMLPFSADWRWLTDRDDSVWYPGLHLHRQPLPGDWSSVYAQVRSALVATQESSL